MRKRLLIGTGASLALVVGAKLRSRATIRATPRDIVGTRAKVSVIPRRGSSRISWLFLHLFTISRLLWPWDPVVDLWNGVSNAVKELVRSVANEIYAYISSGFSWMWNLWETAKRTSQIIWNNLFDFATGLFDGLKRWAYETIVWTYNTLNEAIRAAVRTAENLFASAIAQIGATAAGILSYIADKVTEIYNKWISPLIDGFWNILRWVPEQISNAIGWINTNLIQPLWNFARDVWFYVQQLWSWFLTRARDMIELVFKASWLLILAVSYGPDYWISWVQEQVNRLPTMIVGFAENAASKEGSRIENWLVRWLGI